MQTGRIECSIVIVSYNVKDFLLNCVESIYQSEGVLLEVIVVDNNSSDGSIALLKKKYPQVMVVENGFNAGFSEANNQGIRMATGNSIFLLNPDTKLKEDTVSKLRNYLVSRQDAGIVAPGLLNADGTRQFSAFRFPSLVNVIMETFYLHRLFSISEYPSKRFEDIFQPDFVSGAAMMFKKDLVDSIGYLDPGLFWMEDVDFCFRARRFGLKIIYYPASEMVHYGGESQKKNLSVAISNQLISKLKFEKKHCNGIAFFLSCFFIFIHILSRILFFSTVSLFVVNGRIKRAAYFYSFKRFNRFIIAGDESIT
jgi:GT2 family glycosyltransferase